jgi:hypothetical protein
MSHQTYTSPQQGLQLRGIENVLEPWNYVNQALVKQSVHVTPESMTTVRG